MIHDLNRIDEDHADGAVIWIEQADEMKEKLLTMAAKPVIIQGLSDGPCSTHNEIYGTGGFVVVRDGAVKALPTAPNESKGTQE